MTGPDRADSSSRTSSRLFDVVTAPARLLSRYRADLAASLADDAATFAGSARLVFAALALIAVAYPLVASGMHATVHAIPRSEADQIILSPFFEDVYVETPLFMLAAVVVGLFSPALGVLFVLVLAPADLIAAAVAPITELVAPAQFDLVLIPIAGRVVSYALLWVLAVEIPLLIRAYALVLASRLGRQTSVLMVVATSVASTLVLVFLWARAIPYLIQPVGRWSFNGNVNFLANTAMHDHWWVVVVGASLVAAIAALWPKPIRENEYRALATAAVPRSNTRQLLREIGAVVVVAVLLSGLMSTLATAVLLTGSLFLTGPVLNRLIPRLPAPRIGPPPRSPARWVLALGVVLALSWVALVLAPSDITDGYLVVAAVVAVALPLFRILLDVGRPSVGSPRPAAEHAVPPPVLTSIVVLLALCLLLMLPSAVLANDKSTADELLEFAKGQWDSFLGVVGGALMAAGAALTPKKREPQLSLEMGEIQPILSLEMGEPDIRSQPDSPPPDFQTNAGQDDDLDDLGLQQ